ncbi:hypothetical protein YC2023_057482 [Brassica napus]
MAKDDISCDQWFSSTKRLRLCRWLSSTKATSVLSICCFPPPRKMASSVSFLSSAKGDIFPDRWLCSTIKPRLCRWLSLRKGNGDLSLCFFPLLGEKRRALSCESKYGIIKRHDHGFSDKSQTIVHNKSHTIKSHMIKVRETKGLRLLIQVNPSLCSGQLDKALYSLVNEWCCVMNVLDKCLLGLVVINALKLLFNLLKHVLLLFLEYTSHRSCSVAYKNFRQWLEEEMCFFNLSSSGKRSSHPMSIQRDEESKPVETQVHVLLSLLYLSFTTLEFPGEKIYLSLKVVLL